MTQPVTALLQRWLPGHELEIDRAQSGGSTEVFRVRSGGDVFWLRLAEQPVEDRSVEYFVHSELRRLGVRVPDVLMSEVSPPELDRSACLTSHIGGVPLTEIHDSEIARHGAEAAGRDLATLNAVRTEGFGWIDRRQADPTTIVAVHPSRSEWTIEYDNATRRLLADSIVPAELNPIFRQVMRDWTNRSTSRSGHLVHGDFDATHIYVDPETGDYTGIIDLGEARGADSSYDLGHALLHDSEVGRSPLFDSIVSGWSGGSPGADLLRESRFQAIAIATLQLSILLDRGQSSHRQYLTSSMCSILRQIAGED